MRVENKPKDLPVLCPYCSAKLDRMLVEWAKFGINNDRSVYTCPYCNKILGMV